MLPPARAMHRLSLDTLRSIPSTQLQTQAQPPPPQAMHSRVRATHPAVQATFPRAHQGAQAMHRVVRVTYPAALRATCRPPHRVQVHATRLSPILISHPWTSLPLLPPFQHCPLTHPTFSLAKKTHYSIINHTRINYTRINPRLIAHVHALCTVNHTLFFSSRLDVAFLVMLGVGDVRIIFISCQSVNTLRACLGGGGGSTGLTFLPFGQTSDVIQIFPGVGNGVETAGDDACNG